MGVSVMTYPYFLYLCIVEEILINKTLHKFTILVLKFIPMLLALTSLINTILSCFDIDVPALSYIGGVSLLPLIFLYLSSYAFHFCTYHRMFLHYVVVTEGINIIDYYWGFPISDRGMLMLYVVIAGIFLFLILYYHQKCKKDGSLYR